MGECVIFNPAAGRGKARRLIQKLKRLRASTIDLRPTRGPGHGAELAVQAIETGHDTIIAAGGDGTVHEVAGGVIAARRPETVFGVWPIGSANDYAFALGLHGNWPFDSRRRQQLVVAAVDVGRATTGRRVEHFVNGLGLGFNSAVTLEAQNIRGLRGMSLYGLAFLKAMWKHFRCPNLSIEVDGTERDTPTLALTVNIGQREGGFLVTPKASLDDGLFDFVHAGPLSRWRALTMLPRLATGTLPSDNPLIRQGRCRSLRIRAREPLRVHLDGEIVWQPNDGITDLRIENIPDGLRVLRHQPIGK